MEATKGQTACPSLVTVDAHPLASSWLRHQSLQVKQVKIKSDKEATNKSIILNRFREI